MVIWINQSLLQILKKDFRSYIIVTINSQLSNDQLSPRINHLARKVRFKDMVSMEAKSKWQCPKCGVGLPYNPTYKLEGLCSTCRAYEDSDRLLGGYRLKKTRIP
jgi:transcription initiation factor IIE alpha subunit